MGLQLLLDHCWLCLSMLSLSRFWAQAACDLQFQQRLSCLLTPQLTCVCHCRIQEELSLLTELQASKRLAGCSCPNLALAQHPLVDDDGALVGITYELYRGGTARQQLR